ncbi:hypothetical protein OSTOST_19112, partial [Ostertagia ostertagi]
MLVSLCKFLIKLSTNAIDMLSSYLNRLSREHRYVAYVLSKEKEKLKEGRSESLSDTSVRLTDLRHRMNMDGLLLVQSEADIQRMESAALTDWQQRSVMARLMNALGSCVAANTDLLCYFLAVLAHASGGGLINSSPATNGVPLGNAVESSSEQVFLGGNDSVHRVRGKLEGSRCQFHYIRVPQQRFKPQSKQGAPSLTGRRTVLGVQRQSNFAAFDVPLLFALFFHRYMLRKLGLWKDANLTVTFNRQSDEGGVEYLGEHEGPAKNAAKGKAKRKSSKDKSASSSTQQSTERAADNGQSLKAAKTQMDMDPNAVASSGTQVSPAPPKPADGDRLEAGVDADAAQARAAEDPDAGRNPLSRFILQLFKPKFRYIR